MPWDWDIWCWGSDGDPWPALMCPALRRPKGKGWGDPHGPRPAKGPPGRETHAPAN